MSDTKTAAKPKTVEKTVKPKAEPRAPRAPQMTIAQKFEVMNMVKSAPASMPDATLAAAISHQLGRQIQQQTVANYRKEFGLQSVRKPSAQALQAHIDALRAQVISMGGTPCDPPAQAQPWDTGSGQDAPA